MTDGFFDKLLSQDSGAAAHETAWHRFDEIRLQTVRRTEALSRFQDQTNIFTYTLGEFLRIVGIRGETTDTAAATLAALAQARATSAMAHAATPQAAADDDTKKEKAA